MRYHVAHRTLYTYESPVTVSHHRARLAPRELPHQHCPWHAVEIHPVPVARHTRLDSNGNEVLYFEMAGSHSQLEVLAHSYVEVNAPPRPDPESTPPWETLALEAKGDGLRRWQLAWEYRYASRLVTPGPLFAEYARPSFPPGRPVLAAALELNHRLFKDFVFDPTATDVATPVAEAFAKRRGVCQDFAHILIACLRSLGLPARYVSGYLETDPPPGKPKLVGADASHAWVAVWCGSALGWVDLDPTNDLMPGERHITVAWGRDFADVSPLYGITWGAGEQWLLVGVDVTRVEEPR